MKNILENLNTNILYLIALVVSFFISMILTPFVIKFAKKIGAIDKPKARGVHKEPKPLAGGIAIVFSFVITSIIFVPNSVSYDAKQFLGILVAGLLIAGVGFLDDLYQLSAKIRLIVQITAAVIVIFTGTRIDWFTWFFSDADFLFLGAFSNIITVIWIVGLTNAMNLIDGLDGLAAGVASIASISFFVISVIFSSPISAILAAILAGACIGFLPMNFNPAKIFMGDTGSTFLGFMLAVISIQGLTKGFTLLTFFIGVVVFGLPIFDTSFAIVRRVAKRQSIATADRGHLHHRLVDKGIGHRNAVLTMYLVAALFGLAGVLFAMQDFVLTAVIVALVLGLWIYDIIKNKSK